MKQKFYSLDKILDINAQYNLIIGERSNGKSYAVKEYILKEAYKGNKFAYVRRWKEETKVSDIELYFDDFVCDDKGQEKIREITNNEYTDISVYRGEIFFANLDEQLHKIRGMSIGYYFALTTETHYKSLQYPQVSNMVFEEFITDSGYLPHEPQRLQRLVSTIFRRRTGKIFMIGNTITRSVPYFKDWQLRECITQKQGEIIVYKHKLNERNEDGNLVEIKIAVEYCTNLSRNTKLLFGNTAKTMVSGEWETQSFLQLEEKYEHYKSYYTMFAQHDYFLFRLSLIKNDKELFVYVEKWEENEQPKEIPDKARIVSNTFNTSIYSTMMFNQTLNCYDLKVYQLLQRGKIVVSDNLTGTDFCNAFNIKYK